MMNRRSMLVATAVVVAALGGCAEQAAGPAAPGAQPIEQLMGRREAGWLILLDNAGSLDNWNRVGSARWREIEGAIQADRSEGFLVTKDSYANFQLRVEFWVDDAADSGILIRCSLPSTINPATAYEVNIHDRHPEPGYGTGAIVNVARTAASHKAAGKWNVYEITARGTQLTVVLNGIRTVDVRDAKFAIGPIALEYAGGVVRFRKVQLRPL